MGDSSVRLLLLLLLLLHAKDSSIRATATLAAPVFVLPTRPTRHSNIGKGATIGKNRGGRNIGKIGKDGKGGTMVTMSGDGSSSSIGRIGKDAEGGTMVTMSGDGSHGSNSIGKIGKDGKGGTMVTMSGGGSNKIAKDGKGGTRSLRSLSQDARAKILSMAIPTRRTTFFYINVADVVATLLESIVFP